MDPDPDPTPDPAPDPTPFFSDFKDAKKNFLVIFSYCLPSGTLFSVLKIYFLLKFCVIILFCKHYVSPLNTSMRKGKDPEPDPDPYSD